MDSELNNIYLEPLTKRETEILQLLASGQSNKEIADTLFVEISTIKWHNSQIYEKLQVKNRKQAIIRARTLGILEGNISDPVLRIQHNLPADTFPFIGREQEIKEIVQYLTDETFRFITLLGIGGMGKTRLSIEIGRRLISYFRDGVYFIPLSPVTSTEQIVTTLAEVIGFKFHSDNQPQQQLLNYLQNLHLLLIMDNFEHLLDSAELLTDILHSAPKIKMLVTSREKLNLAGEVVYLLNGLALPFKAATQVMTDYDAVQLLMASAQRIKVRIDSRETPVVARICQLLGGMPLAILLAAAWLDTLSLTEIEAEIHAGLGILEANLRDEPVRHHSIQATFDTSWKRLSTQEQAVFMRLSVFRDGFARAAAQKVTGASIRDLQRLVHTSFIQLTPSGRYTIHELMRQYGEQKLKASGETRVVQEKHAQYFAEFITPLGDTPWGMATREMLETVNGDFENVRAAWLYQVEQKNIAELRRFLDGLWIFFDQYSRSQEGIELFESLLIMFQDENEDYRLFHGQILARLGWFYSDVGKPQKSVELREKSLGIVEKFNATNDILLIYFLFYLSLIMTDTNSLQWKPFAEKGFELAHLINSPKWLPTMTVAKATCYEYIGNYIEAKNLFESVPQYKFRTTMETVMMITQRRFEEVEQLLLSGFKKYHLHRIEYIIWYGKLFECAMETKDYKKAWRFIQSGLQYCDDAAYAWGAFWVFTYALKLHVAEKQYNLAARLCSLMINHPSSLEGTNPLITAHEEIIRTHLPANEFEAAWEHGKHLDLGDVITEYMER